MILGDAAVALLKAGAEIDKRDSDGQLALNLAPDKEVCHPGFLCLCLATYLWRADCC